MQSDDPAHVSTSVSAVPLEELQQQFVSIFAQDGRPLSQVAGWDDLASDLNLDRVLAALNAGRRGDDLGKVFRSPLSDLATVEYRHDVVRDLQRPEVLAPVRRFAEAMGRVRLHSRQDDRRRDGWDRRGWFLESAAEYCEAVEELADDLAGAELASQGMRGLRRHVERYRDSDSFQTLAAETRSLQHDLADIRYTVLIRGLRVTVNRFAGQTDYAAEVADLFARFRRRDGESRLLNPGDRQGMNHVEAWIAERVALSRGVPRV